MLRAFRPVVVFVIVATFAIVSTLPFSAALAARHTGSTVTDKTLTLPSQAVTTTTGKTLDLRLQAQWDAITKGDASVLVQLSSLPTSGGTGFESKPYEIFSWTFHLSSAAFTVSSSKATISVPSSKIGWYGSMSLEFGSSVRHAENCSSGSATLAAGTITGSFNFNSTQNSHSGWGGVHDGSVSWKNAALEVSDNCIPVTALLGCVTGYTWTSPSESLGGVNSQEFGGEKAKVASKSGSQGVDFLWLQRTTMTQIDGTTVQRGDYENDPGTNSLSGTQMVSSKPSAGSPFSGSASYRLSKPSLKELSIPTGTCKGPGGKTEKGCDTVYGPGKSGSGTWTDGKPPLTASLTIGGNATEPSRTATGFDGGSIDLVSTGACKT